MVALGNLKVKILAYRENVGIVETESPAVKTRSRGFDRNVDIVQGHRNARLVNEAGGKSVNPGDRAGLIGTIELFRRDAQVLIEGIDFEVGERGTAELNAVFVVRQDIRVDGFFALILGLRGLGDPVLISIHQTVGRRIGLQNRKAVLTELTRGNDVIGVRLAGGRAQRGAGGR